MVPYAPTPNATELIPTLGALVQDPVLTPKERVVASRQRTSPGGRPLQGYLAHKKQRPPGTIQWEYT